MRICLPLFCTLLFCSSSLADDAVGDLAPHLGKTPALVVVVYGGDGENLRPSLPSSNKPLGRSSAGGPPQRA